MCGLQNKIASKGRGILAMDESNATAGMRPATEEFIPHLSYCTPP